ncbi:hypothetical protein KQI84_05250 [bacterium]|nr:hypothetical protein [bacterium]
MSSEDRRVFDLFTEVPPPELGDHDILAHENWPFHGFRQYAEKYLNALPDEAHHTYDDWDAVYDLFREDCVVLSDEEVGAFEELISIHAQEYGVPRELLSAIYHDTLQRFPMFCSETILFVGPTGESGPRFHPKVLCGSGSCVDHMVFEESWIGIHICASDSMAFVWILNSQAEMAGYNILVRAVKMPDGHWLIDASWLMGIM